MNPTISIILSILMGLSGYAYGQVANKMNIVTPVIAEPYENDSHFINPAELILHKQYGSVELTFSAINNRSGLNVFGHMPDIFGLGHLAGGVSYYGSDLPNNLMFIEKAKPCDSNPFLSCKSSNLALIEGGSKYNITWAKETRFLSIGLQYRYYNFENLKDRAQTQNAHSFDGGVFITPFKETFFGLSVRNIGDSELKNADGDTIYENNEKVIFPETYMFTFGLTSAERDLAIAAGIPLELLEKIKDNPNDVVKKVSIQISKVFENTFELTTGYNTRDFFVRLGFIHNYGRLSISASKQAVDGSDAYISFALNVGLPFDKPLIKSTKKGVENPQVKSESIKPPSAIQTSRRASLKPIEKKENSKTRYELDDEIYKELEEEVDQEIKNLEIKKNKIKKLKRKNEIEKEIDSSDN